MNTDLENEYEGITPEQARQFRKFYSKMILTEAQANGQCTVQPRGDGRCCTMQLGHKGPHGSPFGTHHHRWWGPKTPSLLGTRWFKRNPTILGEK